MFVDSRDSERVSCSRIRACMCDAARLPDPQQPVTALVRPDILHVKYSSHFRLGEIPRLRGRFVVDELSRGLRSGSVDRSPSHGFSGDGERAIGRKGREKETVTWMRRALEESRTRKRGRGENGRSEGREGDGGWKMERRIERSYENKAKPEGGGR